MKKKIASSNIATTPLRNFSYLKSPESLDAYEPYNMQRHSTIGTTENIEPQINILPLTNNDICKKSTEKCRFSKKRMLNNCIFRSVSKL